MSHCQPNQVNLNFYQREKASLTSFSIKSVDASLDQQSYLWILKWRWRKKNKAELPAEVAECMQEEATAFSSNTFASSSWDFSPWESHSVPILKEWKGSHENMNKQYSYHYPFYHITELISFKTRPKPLPVIPGFILHRKVRNPGDSPVLWRGGCCAWQWVEWWPLKRYAHFPNSGAPEQDFL